MSQVGSIVVERSIIFPSAFDVYFSANTITYISRFSVMTGLGRIWEEVGHLLGLELSRHAYMFL